MGSYCEAKGFYRKKIGMQGSICCPEVKTSKEIYCENCNIKVKKIKIKEDHSTKISERGSLSTTWDIINIKCHKCGNEGEVTENYREKDTTYYSNEEIKVYNI